MANMRVTIPACIVMLFVVFLQPLASSSGPLLPGMSVTLTPPTTTANFTSNNSLIIKLNGTVVVSQNRLSSMSVALTSTTNVGWTSSCDPATLSYRGSSSQTFTCSVTIPTNTTNDTGTVKVTAKGQTHFLLVTNFASAQIDVKGLNNTSNQTKSKTTSSSGGGTNSNTGVISTTMLMAIVVIVVVVVVAVVGFYLLRKRKAHRLEQQMDTEAAAQPT